MPERLTASETGFVHRGGFACCYPTRHGQWGTVHIPSRKSWEHNNPNTCTEFAYLQNGEAELGSGETAWPEL